MAQRDTSVFTYLFVASLLVVVALVITGLMMNARVEERTLEIERLTSRLNDEKDTSKKHLGDLSALRSLVAGSDEPWPGNEYYTQQLRNVEERVNEFAESIPGISSSSYSGLIDPVNEFTVVFDKLKTAWEQESVRAKENLVRYEKLRETNKDQVDQLDGDKQDIRNQLNELEQKFQENDRRLTQSIEDLTNQMAEQEEQCTEEQLNASKNLAFMENENRQLRTKLESFQDKLKASENVEDIEPDGQILAVETKSKTVWINLGLKDHLRPGLVFRVFQYSGGKKIWKGSVEVRRVDDDYARGRIIEETDPLNPLSVDDHITSPFYDPKASPVFVFAGDRVANTDYSMSYLSKKLESYGAKIEDKVKIDTDFLVAFQNYESTSEYEAARELGVTILGENDLLKYLGN